MTRKELPKYPKYSDSGVEWIGEIPEGWEIRRLKMASRAITTGSTPKDDFFDDDGPIPWYSPGDFGNGIKLISSKKTLCEDAFSFGIRKFPANSVLIVGIGATIGKVAFVDKDCSGNQQINCITTQKIASAEFLTHYFTVFNDIMKMISNSATIGIMNQSKTGEIYVTIPPPNEQNTILTFLDIETGKIDRLMDVRRKQIEVLREQRSAVIHHAVTRGLDSTVPMKDSGIEWLGEIPAHWEVRRLKYMATIMNGQDYKKVEAETGYPVIGSGGQFAFASQYLFNGESVLFGRKGTIDKPLYVNGAFWTIDTMFYSEIRKDVCPRYLYFSALGFPFGFYSTQTALPSMTQQDLSNHLIAVPPLTEQKEIVTYIDRETGKIDTLIEKYERELALLEEYRASLISHAVTGKIDVRGLVDITEEKEEATA